jgi:D-lactate dehydrogenase (cytochrome)
MNAPHDLNAWPILKPRPVPAPMLQALKARFGDRCSTARAVREQHGRDESPFDVPPPEAVVFAESNEDVAAVVALATEHGVPVIPFGVGSSLEGHLLAVQGGVSVDLSRMNRVLRVNAEDQTVTVQAGVTRMQLNREIKDTGLFFPIDPGADATRYQCGALRHDARKRAGPDRDHRRRPHRAHRHARAQEQRGL